MGSWLLRDHSGECAVEGLLWATQGSPWPVCCGRATLGYSGITLASVLWKSTLGYFGLLRDHLASVLWKSYFGLLRDHFGQCAVEELLWATQGSLWPVCCGRAKLGYREYEVQSSKNLTTPQSHSPTDGGNRKELDLIIHSLIHSYSSAAFPVYSRNRALT